MKKILALVAIAVSLSAAIEPAFAKGFSGGRSSISTFRSSSVTRSYSAPRPTYTAPARPVVVQKNVTHVTQVNQVAQSSGGGFLSTFAGAMAGSAVGQWLFSDKKEEPKQVPMDCSAEANKTLPVCQPK